MVSEKHVPKQEENAKEQGQSQAPPKVTQDNWLDLKGLQSPQPQLPQGSDHPSPNLNRRKPWMAAVSHQGLGVGVEGEPWVTCGLHLSALLSSYLEDD